MQKRHPMTWAGKENPSRADHIYKVPSLSLAFFSSVVSCVSIKLGRAHHRREREPDRPDGPERTIRSLRLSCER